MVKRLPGPFGVEFEGLDVSVPLPSETVVRILDLLHENRVLVFRDQTLALDRYQVLSEHFGRPHPHVLTHRRLDDFPAIISVTNVTQDGAPYVNGAAHWHTDQSYEEEPASATMLYSVKAPNSGAQTRFVDMVHAYESLDPSTKVEIESLEVEHLYGSGIAASTEDGQPSPLINQRQVDAVPAVRHRLVRPHPVTGRKALYSPCGTSRGIVGMPLPAAKDLLERLTEHALKPSNQYWHQYRVGDVVVWDTAATMHAASPIEAAAGEVDIRLLYRISVKGIPSSLLSCP